MDVSSYIFQSPYHSQMQIGRPDTSATKQENATQNALKTPNPTIEKAQSFQASQTQEVKPTVQDAPLLDTYA
ncbi:MAG TPA: hypothetical protein CFH84_03185 [Sulfurimonas sp. UBA12504]|nr:MAG: hypothetical protein A2019_09810 [Sulfurimonas sp. GWF2_37_8]DAB30610.1 MAG TPA: hypothetical protein CFH84_03185 [Sulfurimonas sp. UBA12504]